MALQQSFEPNIDAAGVARNMDVYSRDGKKVGVVSEVWAYIPAYGYVARSSFQLADYGPIGGTGRLFDGVGGYLQVRTRTGVRREGDEDLFVPLDAVEDVVSGQALIIASVEPRGGHPDARPDGLATSL